MANVMGINGSAYKKVNYAPVKKPKAAPKAAPKVAPKAAPKVAPKAAPKVAPKAAPSIKNKGGVISSLVSSAEKAKSIVKKTVTDVKKAANSEINRSNKTITSVSDKVKKTALKVAGNAERIVSDASKNISTIAKSVIKKTTQKAADRASAVKKVTATASKPESEVINTTKNVANSKINLAVKTITKVRENVLLTNKTMHIAAKNVEKAKQMPGGNYEKAKQMPGGNYEKAKQMPGGNYEKAKQMPRENTEKAKQMPGGNAEKAKQMPGGNTEKAKQMPGGKFDSATMKITRSRDSGEVFNKCVDTIQTVLDYVGLAPGIGEAADLVNAGIYTLRKDPINASLSVASGVPFAGWFATGGKLVNKGVKTIKTAEEVSKIADKTKDVAINIKTIDNIGSITKKADKPLTKAIEGGTASPSEIAKSWQGTGKYPGVDRYKDITIKQDKIIYRGEPNGTEYFTTKSALERSGYDANNLFEGLQVEKNLVHGYRSEMQGYKATIDLEAAFGLTKANPQFGKGGLPQIFIPDANDLIQKGYLIPVENIPLNK